MRQFHNEPIYRPQNEVSHMLIMAIGVLFWAAVIFALVMIINRYAKRNDPNQTVVHDPIDVAKMRYAKGEINKDEFIQLKKDLS